MSFWASPLGAEPHVPPSTARVMGTALRIRHRPPPRSWMRPPLFRARAESKSAVSLHLGLFSQTVSVGFLPHSAQFSTSRAFLPSLRNAGKSPGMCKAQLQHLRSSWHSQALSEQGHSSLGYSLFSTLLIWVRGAFWKVFKVFIQKKKKELAYPLLTLLSFKLSGRFLQCIETYPSLQAAPWTTQRTS